jgi:hypothetical protein
VFVQKDTINCFQKSAPFKKGILIRVKRGVGDDSFSASIVWGQDTLSWQVEKMREGKYFLNIHSYARGYRKRLRKSEGQLRNIIRLLFLHNIRNPAFVSFEHQFGKGNVVYSPPIPVPKRYLDFWAYTDD